MASAPFRAPFKDHGFVEDEILAQARQAAGRPGLEVGEASVEEVLLGENAHGAGPRFGIGVETRGGVGFVGEGTGGGSPALEFGDEGEALP